MRINSLFMIAILLMFATVACASVAIIDDGTYEGEASSIDFTGSTVTFDGSKATVPLNALDSVEVAGTAVFSSTLSITGADSNSIDITDLSVSGTDLYFKGNKLTN